MSTANSSYSQRQYHCLCCTQIVVICRHCHVSNTRNSWWISLTLLVQPFGRFPSHRRKNITHRFCAGLKKVVPGLSIHHDVVEDIEAHASYWRNLEYEPLDCSQSSPGNLVYISSHDRGPCVDPPLVSRITKSATIAMEFVYLSWSSFMEHMEALAELPIWRVHKDSLIRGVCHQDSLQAFTTLPNSMSFMNVSHEMTLSPVPIYKTGNLLRFFPQGLDIAYLGGQGKNGLFSFG